MEYLERPGSSFIKIGEVEPSRISQEIGFLYGEVEKNLRQEYIGRPVPENVIYKQLQAMVEAQMYQFPFYDQVETAAKLISAAQGDKDPNAVIDIDDRRWLTREGADFCIAAAAAIWSIDHELKRQGFDYDSDKHQLSAENIAEFMDETISDEYPYELHASRHRHNPGKRYIRADMTQALAKCVVEDAEMAYHRHRHNWVPLLKQHPKLFSRSAETKPYYSRQGVGFAISVMESLSDQVNDTERLVSGFLAQIDTLNIDELKKSLKGRFDSD